jgi:catechol 2,3-dioxygenase-like lactoylglutathione lyase family enzyme
MTGDGAIPVTGVIEITLEQNDLAAAEEFYAGVLGFPVVERWADETVWVMAADRTRIGLWRPQIGLGGGGGGVHVHYAMGVAHDSYDALIERLRKHGYTVLDHDHGGYGRHGRGRAAYVTDPGGHVVEFWTWDVATHLEELAAGESPGSR